MTKSDQNAPLFKELPELDLDQVKGGSESCRWPLFTLQLFAQLRDSLKDLNDGDERALAIVRKFAQNFGGESLYLPKASALENHFRNFAVWNDYTGNNIHLLCRKYKLSEPALYRIIANMRELEKKRRQPDLF
ncbi:hypothetical protein F9L16_15935 [Agarivorans sp. B2Z047]|uniref:Mor transcription activator family protein n=1 Tax=Agarivorans sp. B2Z047 TaxID=2652721 RepID=UPI00128CFE9F|nr:Mor transcription activator family protein [Agarivorans sp. B2Z047]MPW30477.1 hypothetical protein [Agarivorans sp. B2Z047]UQN42303.1 hypothetical protein LQZ07_21410 [Agarivorans sp. B2Z047]